MVDVAASIIGILAAAGKITETLTPIISVLKDVNKHTAIILAEVNASRTILSQLHAYLYDLDALPESRKDLIPLHSLVATFTDGTLLFSELEAIVCRLDSVNGTVSKRIKTALKHSDLDSLSARLQTFKLSISTILGILCCKSDLKAREQHDILLATTAELLSQVAELKRRIDNHTIAHNTRGSQLSLGSEQSVDIFVTPKTSFEVGTRNFGDGDSIRTVKGRLSFENALASSFVYRFAKRGSITSIARPQAWTLKSSASAAPSHAWTTMTSISLSQISSMSLVALPLALNEVIIDPNGDAEDTENENVGTTGHATRLRQMGHYASLNNSRTMSAKINLTTLNVFICGSSDGISQAWLAAFRKLREARDANDLDFWISDFRESRVILHSMAVAFNVDVADSCTHDDFPVLFDLHIRDVDVCILAFYVRSKASYCRLIRDHARIARLVGNRPCLFGVVGLVENPPGAHQKREISSQEGRWLARNLSATYHEIFTKDLYSVSEVLHSLVRKQQNISRTNVITCGSERVIHYCVWLAPGRQAVKDGTLIECCSATYSTEEYLKLLEIGDVFVLMYDADLFASLNAVKRLRASLPLSKQSGAHQLVLAGGSRQDVLHWPVVQKEGQDTAEAWGCGFQMVPQSLHGHTYDRICLKLVDRYRTFKSRS